MMKLFRISYKIIALLYLAIAGVVMMLFYSIGSSEVSPNLKQKAYRKKWLQRVVNAIGLHVNVVGELEADDESSLWVANHISWMDIPVVGSMGSGFLSKAEIRKWPVLGWLGEKGGTVFIQRGGKNAAQIASREIAKKIALGDNILVFPEGTTTSVHNVSLFHARIFAPAVDHQLRVQPIAVQYLDDKGQPHPKAEWVNEHFMKNLIGVLSQRRIHVTLTFLPVLFAKDYQQRKEIAELAEQSIRDIVTKREKG